MGYGTLCFTCHIVGVKAKLWVYSVPVQDWRMRGDLWERVIGMQQTKFSGFAIVSSTVSYCETLLVFVITFLHFNEMFVSPRSSSFWTLSNITKVCFWNVKVLEHWCWTINVFFLPCANNIDTKRFGSLKEKNLMKLLKLLFY
jgi:hypothetical protein